MLERLILHIGTHKTGTTALQSSLARSHDSLLGQGVLYPRAGRRGPGHASLVRELPGPEQPRAATERELVDEALGAAPATLLVSAEDLSAPGFRRPAIAWARQLEHELRPAQTRVIAYVRPQWDYIASSYAQRIRGGWTRASFEEHVEWALGEGSGNFDYVRRFGPWREAFGAELEIRPYARRLLRDGDVVSDFWRAVEIGAPPPESPEHVNRRNGAMTTEMIRALHALLFDHGLDELVSVRRIGRHTERRVAARFPDDPPVAPLTPDLVARIAERFAPSNAELIAEYMSAEASALFTPPEHPAPVTWSLSDASRRERRLLASIARSAVAEARTAARAADSAAPARAQSWEPLARLRWRLRIRRWLKSCRAPAGPGTAPGAPDDARRAA